jgi:GNAT superfamily N-acetyltransferase
VEGESITPNKPREIGVLFYIYMGMKLKDILKEVITPQYWYDSGDKFMGDLVTFEHKLLQKYPELKDLNLTGKENVKIFLHSIRIKPEHYGKGIGTKVLTDIKEYAAKLGLPVVLSPEPDRGKKEALRRFYKNNGFYKCKDSRYTSMFAPVLIWRPK